MLMITKDLVVSGSHFFYHDVTEAMCLNSFTGNQHMLKHERNVILTVLRLQQGRTQNIM